jgi:hypothetical protein
LPADDEKDHGISPRRVTLELKEIREANDAITT